MADRDLEVRTEEGLISIADRYIKTHKDLILPPNYDVQANMTSLYMMLTDPKLQNKQGKQALEVCTPESIKQAVYKCLTKGLDVSRKQAYLIVRGNVLCLDESSFGLTKQAKSICRIRINAVAIHDGDMVDIEMRPNGTKTIKHTTKFQNLDKQVTGAYAVGVNIDTGEIDDSDIMTIQQIRQSWAKRSSSGGVANEFPEEMARKTVRSRLAKIYVNTSDDSYKYEVIDEEGRIITPENNYDYLNENVDEDVNAIEMFNTQASDVVIVEDENEKESSTLEPTLEPLDDILDQSQEEASIEEEKNAHIDPALKTIKYYEYVNNKEKYELIEDSYDKINKTVQVREV